MTKRLVIVVALLIGATFMLQKTKTTQFLSSFPEVPAPSVLREAISTITRGGTDTKSEGSLPKNEWTHALRDINDLHYKVIRTPEDIKKLHAILGSRANMDTALQEVLAIDSSDIKKNQIARMNGVLFLMRSLEWKENPERRYLEDKVSEIILKDDLKDIQNIQLKKSAVADRMELFVALTENNPKAAYAVRARAQSEFQQRILEFATNFYNLNKKEK